MFNNGNFDSISSDGKFETIIGPSVKVEGTLNSDGDISIEGDFKGELNVKSKLNIGREANIDAQINAGNAFIAGKVKGNMTVKDRLELSSSANIDGDVSVGILTMEAGAVLNGKCVMSAQTGALGKAKQTFGLKDTETEEDSLEETKI